MRCPSAITDVAQTVAFHFAQYLPSKGSKNQANTGQYRLENPGSLATRR